MATGDEEQGAQERPQRAEPSARRLAVYPLGLFGIVALNTLFNQWIVYFHAPPSGPTGASGPIVPPGSGEVPPPDGGSAQAIALLLLGAFLLQAVINPCLGALADRLRTPWGRRRPIVLLAAPLWGAAFVLVWQEGVPPVVTVLGFAALAVIVTQPYLSLLPALARDERARVRLSAVGAGVGLLATGVALVGGPLVVHGWGFATLGWLGALALGSTTFLAAALVREPPPGPTARAGVPGHAYRDAAEAARAPGVLPFLVGNGLQTAGLLALIVVAPYVAEALLGGDERTIAQLNGALFAAMLLTTLAVAASGVRLGSAGRLAATSALGAALVAGLALTRSPLAWTLGYAGLGAVALFAIAAPPVILARFVDEDGRERQGVFFGLNGAAINLGNALGGLVTPLLLDLGRSAANPAGVPAVLAFAAACLAAAAVALGIAARPRRAVHGHG